MKGIGITYQNRLTSYIQSQWVKIISPRAFLFFMHLCFHEIFLQIFKLYLVWLFLECQLKTKKLRTALKFPISTKTWLNLIIHGNMNSPSKVIQPNVSYNVESRGVSNRPHSRLTTIMLRIC